MTSKSVKAAVASVLLAGALVMGTGISSPIRASADLPGVGTPEPSVGLGGNSGGYCDLGGGREDVAVGVRLYYAPSSILDADGKIVNDTNLYDYSSRAVYAFSDANDNSSFDGIDFQLVKSMSKKTWGYGVGWEFRIEDVVGGLLDSRLILDKSGDSTLDFSAVDAGSMTKWATGDRDWIYTPSHVANWANSQFQDSTKFSQFVEGYYNYLKNNDVPDWDKVPKNMTEFSQKDYVLVAELVAALPDQADPSHYYIMTYQMFEAATNVSSNPWAYGCYCLANNADMWWNGASGIFPKYKINGTEYSFNGTGGNFDAKGYGIFWGTDDFADRKTNEVQMGSSFTAYDSEGQVSNATKALSTYNSQVVSPSFTPTGINKKDDVNADTLRSTNYNDDVIAGKVYSVSKTYLSAVPAKLFSDFGITSNTQGAQAALGFAPLGSSLGDKTYTNGSNSGTAKGDEMKDDYYLRYAGVVKIGIKPSAIPNLQALNEGHSDMYSLNMLVNNSVNVVQGKYSTKLKEVGIREATGSSLTFGKSITGSLYNTADDTEVTAFQTAIIADIKSQLRTDLGVGDDALVVTSMSADGNTLEFIEDDQTKINNVLVNNALFARSTSSIDVDDTSRNIKYTGTGDDNDQEIGVTFNYFVRNQDVTSRVAFISRNSSGTITYGSNDSVTYGMSSSGSIGTGSISGSGKTVIIAVKDTQAVKDAGYSLSTDVTGAGYADLLDGLYMGSASGPGALQTRLRSDVNSEATVTVITAGASQSMGVGAFLDNGIPAGYNIIIFHDEMTKPPQQAEAKLSDYELSYYYPTLLGDSAGTLVKVDHNVPATVTIGRHSSYGGDVISYHNSRLPSIYFNTRRATTNTNSYKWGKFGKENVATKTFGVSELSTLYSAGSYVSLNYAFQLSRGVFGDNVKVSPLNASNKALFNAQSGSEGYVQNTLGFSYSMNESNRASGSAGQQTDLANKKDYWLFTGSYPYTYTDAEGVTHTEYYSPFAGGESKDKAGYELTEKAKKYTPNNRSKGINSSKGTTLVSKAEKQSSGYTFKYITSPSGTLKFCPEVAMSVAMPIDVSDANNGQSAGANVLALYVMGEKVREIEPSVMYNIRVVSNSGNNRYSGTTTSSATAVGSGADRLKSTIGDGKYPVIYAGADISTTFKTTDNVCAEFYGFSLDILDVDKDTATVYSGNSGTTATALLKDAGGNDTYADLISEWGSSDINTKSNFESWVGAIKKNLYISANYQTPDNGAIYTFGSERLYNGSNAGNANATLQASYNIKVAKGAVVKDGAYNELIAKISEAYDVSTMEAESIFNNSGMVESITKAIESRNSADNGSSTESTLGFFGGAGTHWYDETANYFVVRFYRSTISLVGSNGKAINGKLDITSGPRQTGALFSNGYRAKWYLSIGIDGSGGGLFDTNSGGYMNTYYDGKNYNNLRAAVDNGGIIVYESQIQDADFVISDATTADMNR